MANDKSTTDYEEARKQRVLENKKRFEDLGILNISKSLTDISKSEKKPKEHRVRPKAYEVYTAEPRRSSRARNPVTYRDDIDVEIPRMRKRSSYSSSWASYLARPLDEVKTASYEDRAYALQSAEKLQSNLQTGNPSFIKSMVRSHVYSCFWLGLPTWFCESHLPKSTVDIVLEDEQGAEYEAIFISKRTGLSGGWRAFALEHKLDDGDALVFELVEPTRFKVYIVRAFEQSTEVDITASEDVDRVAEETATGAKRRNKTNEQSNEVDITASEETDRDAEETVTEVKRRKRTSDSQSKDSAKSNNEKPTRASARIQSKRGK